MRSKLPLESEISREADFYGNMDGAKFVRGDAIAGILITLINIIGGFAIGVFQRDLSLAQAIETYTLLTVGDGLVTQIPALLHLQQRELLLRVLLVIIIWDQISINN